MSQDQINAFGRGRGRGRGLALAAAAALDSSQRGAELSSFRPDWLSESVSPPSFGVGTQAAAAVVGGRGRGDRMLGLVGDMPQDPSPAPFCDEPHRQHNVYLDQGESSSDSSDNEEMIERLKQHHRDWSREIESMTD